MDHTCAAVAEDIELQRGGLPWEELAAVCFGAEERDVPFGRRAAAAVVVVDRSSWDFEEGDGRLEEGGFGGNDNAATGDKGEGTSGAAGGGVLDAGEAAGDDRDTRVVHALSNDEGAIGA